MLIIDGYNVLMQVPLKAKKLEYKRGLFTKILNQRHKMFGGIMVVFDGKDEVEGSYIKEKSAVKVVYTKGETADDWIKSTIEKSKNPRTITVVTDDREVRDFAKMHGSKHIPSQAFIEKIIPRQKELPPEPEKDTFVDSEKAKAITEELKKEWE